MINAYDKPVGMELLPLDWEFLGKMKMYQQERQDKAEDLLGTADDLLNKVSSVPVDTPRKNEILLGYKKRLSDALAKNSNSITGAIPEIKSVLRDAKDNISLGELGGIQSRASQRQKEQSELDLAQKKFISSGGKEGISEEYAKGYLNADESLNQPIKRNLDGTWSSWNTMNRTPHVDLMAKARDIAKDIKPQTIEQLSTWKHTNAGDFDRWVKDGAKTEKLPPKVISEVVQNTMIQDPLVTNFVNHGNIFSGIEDKIKSTNGLYYPSIDSRGNEIAINPNTVRTLPIKNVADAASLIYQVNNLTGITHDMQFTPEGQMKEKSTGEPSVPIVLNTTNITPSNQNLLPQRKNSLPFDSPDAKKAEQDINSGKYKNVPDWLENSPDSPNNRISNSETKQALFEAGRLFGKATSSGEHMTPEDVKLLEKYINWHNKQMVNQGITTWDLNNKTERQTAETWNKDIFGSGPKYGYSSGTNYVVISGTPPDGKTHLTGNEFKKYFGDDKEYSKTISGNISTDNAYVTTGKLTEVSDKQGNKVVLAMENQNPGIYDQGLHQLYQAKYNVTHNANVKLPVQENNKVSYRDFKVEYVPRSSSEIDPYSGEPIYLEQTGPVKLIDKKLNKVVAEVTEEDIKNLGIQDPFKYLYEHKLNVK